MKGVNFDIENLIKFTNGELPAQESMLIREEIANDAFLQQIIEGIRMDELMNEGEESLVDFISRTGSEFKADVLNEDVAVPKESPVTPAGGTTGLGYAVAALAVIGMLTFTLKNSNNITTLPSPTPQVEVQNSIFGNITDPDFSFEVVETTTNEKINQSVKEDFKVVDLNEKEIKSETLEIAAPENTVKANYRVSVSTQEEGGQERLKAEVFIGDDVTDNSEILQKQTKSDVPVLSSKSYSVKVNDADGAEKEMDITINSTKADHGEEAYPTAIYLINALPRGTYQASAVITSNSKIKEGKEVTFISSGSIQLNANFEVKKGGSFEAKIIKSEKKE